MKVIQEYVWKIADEIEDAKDYAEKYLYHKAYNNTKYAKYYSEMANDELKHATYIHEIATETIAKLETTYKPTEEMRETWNKSHAEYVEKVAWIQQMLKM